MDLAVDIVCALSASSEWQAASDQEVDFNVAIDRGLRPLIVKFTGGGIGPSVNHRFSVVFEESL